MFPVIDHIDQLLPAVEGRSDFVVKRTAEYSVIDYVYTDRDTFDEPLRRECRGIKFRPDGTLLARPFQKFWNIGERPDTQPDQIDVSQPHFVMTKLDGSMIHPAIVGDPSRLVFMTRMGVTEIAERAFAHAWAKQQPILAFCYGQLLLGHTPIFEYTAPDNRIVVPYSDTKLTLLAIRHNRTGEYLPLDDVPRSVPVVPHAESISDLAHFMATTRELKNAEGFVIRFESGLMLKLKAEDYVLRHRAKDSIGLEKNALRAVLDSADDDLVALLPRLDAETLRAYAADVRLRLAELVTLVDQLVFETAAGVDRKTFAMEHVPKLPAFLRPAAFQGFSGGDIRWAIIDTLRKHTNTAPRVEAIRKEAGLPPWHEYWHVGEE